MNTHIIQLHCRAAICLLALTACASALHAADRKPNFLFIITDDQRWDTMSTVQKEQGERARYPWLQSPGMDRLAAEGVRFRNAFVTLSLCSPSRAAFLTGRYNHSNGIINNNTPITEKDVTHASLLRAAGYRTAYIGKWHMGDQRGQRPGFDYSVSFVGQGIYQDCPYEVNGVRIPTKGWVDDVTTDFAIDWIKQNREQPFSMVVGLKSPHSKRGGPNLPPRLRDLYTGETSRPVPNLNTPAIYHKPDPKTGAYPSGLSDNAVQIDYLRHIKGADENLGRLLDTLDALNLADDTVVVFTSDNGYFLGEHGCGDKRALYEESLRIPMLARYPKGFGKGLVVDDIVLNIDLAPTFLDLAGVPVPKEMQGASWKEIAAGKKPANWRTSFLAQYYKELGDTPTCVGIRTTNSKLIKYSGHAEWTEVFDLSKDSYEVKNLATDSARTEKLGAELDTWMKTLEYTFPTDAKKNY